MRVLIACECSGSVRETFRARGHDAWSCDIVPATDGSPYHILGDALEALKQQWDLVIAHPPCTYLSNSGVLRLYKNGKKSNGIDEERWVKMRDGALFFRSFFTNYHGPLCVENPIMHGHARDYIGLDDCYRQIIQPWQFGEDASKATVLWLRGLPPLKPTGYFPPRIIDGKKRWSNQTDSGQNRLSPSPTRAAERAVTYKGIAEAFAAQWG